MKSPHTPTARPVQTTPGTATEPDRKRTDEPKEHDAIDSDKGVSSLFLLRHGESGFNRDNRFTGLIEASLTERGMSQMREAGLLLASRGLDIVYSSDLLRTRESARIVLEAGRMEGVPLIASPALNERSYGKLEGLNKEEAIRRFGAEQVQIWRRSYAGVPPGGESLEAASRRIHGFFESRIVEDLRAARKVLICAHGNTLRSLLRLLDDLTDEEFMKLEIASGELLHYGFDRSGRAVLKEKIK